MFPYRSPLALSVWGPSTVAQNCGRDSQLGKRWPRGGSAVPAGVAGGVDGTAAGGTAGVPEVGSFPNVLHGLPIGAEPLKSATADRVIFAEDTPII